MRKLKFNSIFNLYVFVLLTVLVGAVWVEAQTTTNAVTAAAVAPSEGKTAWHLTFNLDRIELLRQPLLGTPVWKYISFLIYVLLAWLASRLVDLIFQQGVMRWAAKSVSKWDDLLFGLLRGPVKVITFVVLLHVGFNIFDWPGWVSLYFSKALKVVVACSVTYMALKAVDLLMKHLRDKATGEDRVYEAQLFPVLSRGLKIFIVLVALLVTAQNLEFNITSILASLSIGGLALGLAAQDTLANLFGAVAVFADKPFKIGDRIQIDAIDGTVEKIGLRSTRIRNLDGHLVTIPNKTVGNATITNISLRPTIRTVMNLGLTYDTPAERVKEAVGILEEIFRAHPKTADLVIGFNKFADFSLGIQVVHFWRGTDYKQYMSDLQDLNLTIKKRFDTAGIEFAFPTQTLHVKKDTA